MTAVGRNVSRESLPPPIGSFPEAPAPREVLEDLRAGLSIYWSVAGDILRKSGIELHKPPKDYLQLERNFFSALFIYSYHRAGIPKPRRVMYAAAVQCLRGMVTGCDNLLDDEYKKTLETDLPETGRRFRSVLDMLVSDRVLFQVLLESLGTGKIAYAQAAAVCAASLQTLAKSGAQEASEEQGVTVFLPPDEILRCVHHYKTGILFQCPWDIPLAVEALDRRDVSFLLEALYEIGIGCQILDDMVDFPSDMEKKRHNYLGSQIYHGPSEAEKGILEKILARNPSAPGNCDLQGFFPAALSRTAEAAHRLLENGLTKLFADEHRSWVAPSVQWLKRRIGAGRFIPRNDR